MAGTDFYAVIQNADRGARFLPFVERRRESLVSAPGAIQRTGHTGDVIRCAGINRLRRRAKIDSDPDRW